VPRIPLKAGEFGVTRDKVMIIRYDIVYTHIQAKRDFASLPRALSRNFRLNVFSRCSKFCNFLNGIRDS